MMYPYVFVFPYISSPGFLQTRDSQPRAMSGDTGRALMRSNKDKREAKEN